MERSGNDSRPIDAERMSLENRLVLAVSQFSNEFEVPQYDIEKRWTSEEGGKNIFIVSFGKQISTPPGQKLLDLFQHSFVIRFHDGQEEATNRTNYVDNSPHARKRYLQFLDYIRNHTGIECVNAFAETWKSEPSRYTIAPN